LWNISNIEASMRQKVGYIDFMTITIEVPDELVAQLVGGGQEPARTVVGAIALDGYRNDRLTEAHIRQPARFRNAMAVDGFLKERGAFMHYRVEDLQHDREVARQCRNENT
jgi:hypothetical protein